MKNIIPRPKKYYPLLITTAIISTLIATISPNLEKNYPQAQAQNSRQPITVRSDVQEANSETGIITARGNVYIEFPSRNIQATSAQAQFFSQERRLVLNGNVQVIQDGNTMRAETMTYLIDEGRFIATPQNQRQVESVYLIEENTP
ncbi:LptA/OstA family protein [Cyanobacterium sp. IPPAS B-1200]|uniref:LptA/OstA family protein n=1 Tax=Cyanobacterium sp. IPPAS B-1200 TaxID=1562720 RepID=UPI00085250A6|nr:LptA/OstA family protein [Cyanobacterium sp. IPPAS B-1200]OEJ80132.1 OstA family protein [Cyanobacterium sp. IPPAS B-1200]